MSIDLSALRTHIKSDQTLNQWGVVEGQTGKVAAWYAAPHESEKKYREKFINKRTILAAFANPYDGATVLTLLQTKAQADAVAAVVWDLLKPSEGGIDIGHPATRAMLASYVTAKELTQAQADTLTNLAAESKTRGEVLFGATPSIKDVDDALKPDRVDGRVGGN